jgi:hypothetical protein
VKLLSRVFVKTGGIKITTGEDGRDVVNLLVNQDLRFDVVLLDENMVGSEATTEDASSTGYDDETACSSLSLPLLRTQTPLLTEYHRTDECQQRCIERASYKSAECE